MNFSKILIVDYGSQYTLLIAKQIRKLNVYTEIIFPEELEEHMMRMEKNLYGIILSGSPKSVEDEDYDAEFLSFFVENTPIPVLGICYGAQLLAHILGAKVVSNQSREFGKTALKTSSNITASDPLYNNILENHSVWMSHSDSIIIDSKLTKLEVLSKTHNDVVGSYKTKDGKIYGLQFHPEVSHTEIGMTLFNNFLNICKIPRDWSMDNYITTTINDLKEKIKDDKVLVACSGGVDSTVTAVMIQRAIGDNMYGVFIDTGLLRKNEYNNVLEAYARMDLNVIGIDSSKEFYERLKGVIEPEMKRKIIGATFIDMFKRHSPGMKWLGQGTIYSDVIESKGNIKSHHNVGGLPKEMNLNLVEPLRYLFKDEVRELGVKLGIDPIILNRHPFPGPGLGIRILGEVTEDKVNMLQNADDIFIQKLKEHHLYDQIWQAGAILLNCLSVGVQGDCRTYESVVALRAVSSVNGMTAKVANLSVDFLTETSTEIINKVKGINRVVYDVTTKPPGTIEWE